MKKKKLLKKIEALEKSFEALITVVQIADRQQTAKLAAAENFLQKEIAQVQSQYENNRYT